MNDADVRDALKAAYSDVVLSDPAEAVMRRGHRIRGARRAARTTYLAVAGLTAGALGVFLAAPQPGPAPVRLVGYSLPALPVSLSPVPRGLELSFDYDSGRLIALYVDRSNSDQTVTADLSLRTGAQEDPQATSEEEVRVQGQPGRLYTRDLPGSTDDEATVIWETAAGTSVSLTGRGSFAGRQAVLTQARNVRDQPLPLDMRLDFAPAGWDLIGYKVIRPHGAVLALGDRDASGAGARRITVALYAGAPRPLVPEQMEDPGPVTPATVEGRAAQVMEGERGWFLQVPLDERAYITLQAPKDLDRDQLLQMAAGVGRR